MTAATKFALILVDIQNDFMESGSLPVPRASCILPTVNELLEKLKGIVIATQDWHPDNHVSFARNHNKQPFESIALEYDGQKIEQVLWPAHCVQGTDGAKIVDSIPLEKIDYTVQKGKNSMVDSYSAFADNQYMEITQLAKILYQNHIETVIIVGLAADFCVKMTCLDAVKFGFRTILVRQGTQAVQPDKFEETMQELASKGVEIVDIQDEAFVKQFMSNA
ncbi:hypothetical protein VTP01DRAFT_8524 [Rhizomucor pusillus]|uniref:uncharacterized protein n=1 Tax=Rhizomucor pusillus TaxID=4840 RepID=UPI0037433359